MQKLVKGVHKFQREIFGRKRDLFERLANGQAPEALFITCSDSRINPALITQTDPGDIFILRNAGNLVPTYDHLGGEAATIEFAVSSRGLAVKDIVVCGHSGCGAMKALLEPPEGFPAMDKWLEHAERTRQLVREKYTNRSGEQLLTVTVQENVLAQVENLRTHPSRGRAAGGRETSACTPGCTRSRPARCSRSTPTSTSSGRSPSDAGARPAQGA